MTAAEQYRVRAAELRAMAEQGTSPTQRQLFESLAQAYMHLANQADRNSSTDLVYETPPPTDTDKPISA
jgi:hypothetical protein